MSIKSTKFFLLSMLLVLSVVACKDSLPEKQEMVDITTDQKQEVTYYITTVDNLRARVGALKSSEVIAKLPEGAIVKSLNEESDTKETVTLRGKVYTEPFRKVLIDDVKEAWVYGGGIKVFSSGYEDIKDVNAIHQFNTFVDGMSHNELSNGNAVLKKLMELSSEDIATNDALYFLSADYMDKLAYQATLQLDKEDIRMSDDYAAIVDRTYDMESSRIGKQAVENGFLLDAHEGMIEYVTDQYALEGAIGGMFSPSVKEYIRLKKNQYKHRLFSDGGISGSLEDLMNDAIDWDNFGARFPNFPESEEVKNTSAYMKSSLFYGTNNSPAYSYNDSIAKKEFRDIWNTTLETYPNASFAKELYGQLQKLEANEWKFSKVN